MTTLTERYLWAATRSVPQEQRDELRRELAERIGDDVDARIEAGAAPEDAEHQALMALGDPGAVAARYLDRPLYLIGPRYYLVWVRLLKVLLASVLPAVAIGLPLVQSLTGVPFGEIVSGTALTLMTVALHLVFWTTLAFAIVERNGGGRPFAEWRVDQLPSGVAATSSVRGDVVANAALVVLTGLAVLLHERFLPFRDGAGEVLPFFQPETWAWLQPYLLVVLVLELAVLAVLHAVGRWTWLLAGIYSVLCVAFVVPLAASLLDGRLFNQPYLDRLGWDALAPGLEPDAPLAVFLVLLVIAGAVVGVWDAMVKAYRSDRTA